jgi:TP901 family phage tail tape measure protein
MQTSLKSQFPNGSAAYKQQLDEVAALQSRYNLLTQSSGAYSVESVKAVSATQALSKSIADQKLTLSGALKNLNNFKTAWREQAALQKSSIVQWTNTTTGKNKIDLYMPKELDSSLDSFRMKYGYINQAIGSIATQTINWGKNTQWAGRQITVGMGVPLAMVFGLMGKAALQADQDLTRITKVYNTTVDSSMSLAQQQASTQAQLDAVKKNAMQDAMSMAKQYAASMDDTLQLEAELAAVGKTGNDLRTTTAQVTRVATLGEIDHNTALQMTISMQNAWKLSSQQLGEAFNYVNDIENATSLTTKDFAEAIPRAAAAMSTMGVSVQDTGVLLVALKQGGVDATEGMNALKSATTRLLKPTADAQDRFNGLGINIMNVTREAGGNLIKILEKLGPMLKDKNEIEKQGAMAALFGTYQYNKMTVALTNTSNAYAKFQAGVNDSSDQTLMAMKVAAQDPSQWAAVAAQEQNQLQKSASFQWKSTIAQMKVEMAGLGKSVLEVMVPIAKGVLGIIKWFNSWGDSSKKIALVIAGMVMLAGPLIMLLGLFANLVGNVVKFGSAMSNLVLRFKVLDPEQRASELMAKQAASAFDAEAGSIARLNMELQNLLKTQVAQQNAQGVYIPGLKGQAAGAQLATMNYAKVTSGVSPLAGAPLPVPMSNGRYKHPETGKFMGAAAAKAMQDEAKAADQAAAAAERQAVATEATGLNVGKIAGKLAMFGIAAFSLKSMLDSSGGLVSNLSSAAMLVMMMQGSGGFTGITKMVKALPGLLSGGMGKATAKVGASLGSMVGKASLGAASIWGQVASKGVLASLGAVLSSPAVIVAGLAGVVAAYVTIVNHMNQAAKTQHEINNSTTAWSQVLGYAEKTYAEVASQGQDKVISDWDARKKKVDELTKANKGLVDELEKANDASNRLARVYKLALDEAFKVQLSGGNKDQAREAFDIALQAAGLSSAEIRQLNVKFDKVKIDDAGSITDHISKQLGDAVSSMNVSTGIGANWLRKLSNSVISEDAQTAGEKIGGAFWEGLQNSKDSKDVGSVVKDVFDKTGAEFQKDDSWKNLWKSEGTQFKEMGINNVQQFYQAMQEYSSGKMSDAKRAIFEPLVLDNSDAGHVTERYGALMDFIWNTIKDKTHMSKAEFDKLKASGFDLDKVTRLLSGDLGLLGGGANTAAAAINNLNSTTGSYAFNASQVTSALQNTMKGYMGDVWKQADNIMSEQYQAQIDGINKAGQARQKGFEAQGKAMQKAQKNETDALKASQDARSKAIDDQIKQTQDAAQAQEDAIQAQIDAENKQDAIRQKLFDREKTRIERLAAMQNDSIDFNAALNSGNMDSAAKLYNTHAATVQGYQIDDQNTAASDALKAKTDGQSAQIDSIKNTADARVKFLQDQKDALQSVFDLESKLCRRGSRMNRMLSTQQSSGPGAYAERRCKRAEAPGSKQARA